MANTRTFNSMTIDEQKETAELFAAWLKMYTDEVIVRVIARRDEIIANDFAMNLLKELKERQEKEAKEFISDIDFALRFGDKESFRFDILTHSKSYRDVLYDMYIKK